MHGKVTWLRVNRRVRCPVCGHSDYCTIASNKEAVHCMRVASDKRCPGTEGGWIHQMPDKLAAVPLPKSTAAPRIADVAGLAFTMYDRPEASAVRLSLAREWGIDCRVLASLMVGAGWDDRGRQFASFPSRDENGKVIGIIRRYPDGKKLTYKGTSNAGVFVEPNWWQRFGPVFIVEGASDLAVLLDNGLCAIGRPSNVGGTGVIAKYLDRRAGGRLVIVIGENDRKLDKLGDLSHGCSLDCSGCSWCWPGKFGAQQTAERLRKWGATVVMPPCGVKDCREWFAARRSVAATLIVHSRNSKKACG